MLHIDILKNAESATVLNPPDIGELLKMDWDKAKLESYGDHFAVDDGIHRVIVWWNHV